MYELVIFDCDGVLVDSEALANQIEVDELKKLGYSIDFKTYVNMAVGRPQADVHAILTEKWLFNLPPHFWEEVEAKQHALFEEELRPIEGVKEALSQLSIPKVVVSSSKMKRLQHTLGLTGLLPFFERVFSTESVQRGKPHPDIFLYAAKEMDIEPEKCLVIEDSHAGVLAAKAANMHVWAFDGGGHITEEKRHEMQSWEVEKVVHHMELLPQLLERQ